MGGDGEEEREIEGDGEEEGRRELMAHTVQVSGLVPPSWPPPLHASVRTCTSIMAPPPPYKCQDLYLHHGLPPSIQVSGLVPPSWPPPLHTSVRTCTSIMASPPPCKCQDLYLHHGLPPSMQVSGLVPPSWPPPPPPCKLYLHHGPPPLHARCLQWLL